MMKDGVIYIDFAQKTNFKDARERLWKKMKPLKDYIIRYESDKLRQ